VVASDNEQRATLVKGPLAVADDRLEVGPAGKGKALTKLPAQDLGDESVSDRAEKVLRTVLRQEI
jgi:hypothetical protein